MRNLELRDYNSLRRPISVAIIIFTAILLVVAVSYFSRNSTPGGSHSRVLSPQQITSLASTTAQGEQDADYHAQWQQYLEKLGQSDVELWLLNTRSATELSRLRNQYDHIQVGAWTRSGDYLYVDTAVAAGLLPEETDMQLRLLTFLSDPQGETSLSTPLETPAPTCLGWLSSLQLNQVPVSSSDSSEFCRYWEEIRGQFLTDFGLRTEDLASLVSADFKAKASELRYNGWSNLDLTPTSTTFYSSWRGAKLSIPELTAELDTLQQAGWKLTEDRADTAPNLGFKYRIIHLTQPALVAERILTIRILDTDSLTSECLVAGTGKVFCEDGSIYRAQGYLSEILLGLQ